MKWLIELYWKIICPLEEFLFPIDKGCTGSGGEE
jgi:hypothetical protein